MEGTKRGAVKGKGEGVAGTAAMELERGGERNAQNRASFERHFSIQPPVLLPAALSFSHTPPLFFRREFAFQFGRGDRLSLSGPRF